MLGTLSKWLRILGFDTIYNAGMEDNEILRIAEQMNRTILSRDRELCSRREGSILIQTNVLEEQINQVLNIYNANEDKILSRCLECNLLLVPVPRNSVPPGRVMEEILLRYDDFWHCPGCDVYYWPGSHYDNMRKKALEYIQSLS